MSEKKTKGDYILEIAELRRQIEHRDARILALETQERGEAVAWLRKNGFRFNGDIEPKDDSELPLYAHPPADDARVAELAARVWVLENSLRHYGTHSDRCDKSRFVNPVTCTCGYDAALTAEKEQK